VPSDRGVSGFWLKISALENDRTKLIGDLGPKNGMLAYGVWVRLFTWQYETASPITGPDHVARLTGLNVRTAERMLQSLAQSLPQSLIQRSGQWYCKRTMQVLEKVNKKQPDAGATVAPEKTEDPDPDPDKELRSITSTPSQDYVLESSNTSRPQSKIVDTQNCPHQEIIQAYHETSPTARRVRTWEGERPKLLRARWKTHPSLDWWRGFFEYIAESEFLTGKVNGFCADLEWIIRPRNFQNINEGKYHGKRIRQT